MNHVPTHRLPTHRLLAIAVTAVLTTSAAIAGAPAMAVPAAAAPVAAVPAAAVLPAAAPTADTFTSSTSGAVQLRVDAQAADPTDPATADTPRGESTGTLPRTGAADGLMSIGGLFLLAAGGISTFLARRRHHD